MLAKGDSVQLTKVAIESTKLDVGPPLAQINTHEFEQPNADPGTL